MEKITFKVEGMSCAHCVHNLQTELNETDGIISAKVFLEIRSAEVEYDETKISKDDIFKIVTEVGYTPVD